jgi:hypothetical protein
LSLIFIITALNPYGVSRSELKEDYRTKLAKNQSLISSKRLEIIREEEGRCREVERLSRRTGLQLNEAKCAVAIKVDGRVMPHPIQRNESDLLSKFATLGDSSELTKYLGILQS